MSQCLQRAYHTEEEVDTSVLFSSVLMANGVDSVAGQGALLRASLCTPVSIPNIISNGNKALYEDSGHPGDLPTEGWLISAC